MQFFVKGIDGRDALERRLAAREAHLASGDVLRANGQLLYAAALLNDDDAMIGSVMIMEFSDEAELQTWLRTEPYVVQNVWESVEVVPCRVGPAFSSTTS